MDVLSSALLERLCDVFACLHSRRSAQLVIARQPLARAFAVNRDALLQRGCLGRARAGDSLTPLDRRRARREPTHTNDRPRRRRRLSRRFRTERRRRVRTDGPMDADDASAPDCRHRSARAVIASAVTAATVRSRTCDSSSSSRAHRRPRWT